MDTCLTVFRVVVSSTELVRWEFLANSQVGLHASKSTLIRLMIYGRLG
jgi:hypothetical protein